MCSCSSRAPCSGSARSACWHMAHLLTAGQSIVDGIGYSPARWIGPPSAQRSGSWRFWPGFTVGWRGPWRRLSARSSIWSAQASSSASWRRETRLWRANYLASVVKRTPVCHLELLRGHPSSTRSRRARHGWRRSGAGSREGSQVTSDRAATQTLIPRLGRPISYSGSRSGSPDVRVRSSSTSASPPSFNEFVQKVPHSTQFIVHAAASSPCSGTWRRSRGLLGTRRHRPKRARFARPSPQLRSARRRFERRLAAQTAPRRLTAAPSSKCPRPDNSVRRPRDCVRTSMRPGPDASLAAGLSAENGGALDSRRRRFLAPDADRCDSHYCDRRRSVKPGGVGKPDT